MAKGKYQEWLTPDGLIRLEGWARDGLTDEQIANNIGIAAGTLYAWKNAYPEISEALKRGKDVIDREVENALFRRAVGFEYEEYIYERITDTGEAKRHNGVQALTQKEWEMCQAYFDYSCCYCGSTKEITKDHLQPLKANGKMSVVNIVPACRSCNSSKKDRQWQEWYTKSPQFDQTRYEKISKYISFAAKMGDLMKSDSEGQLIVTKKVKKRALPDTTAMIFWLKNRKPEQWRDKPLMSSVSNDTDDDGFLDALSASAEEDWKQHEE